MSLEALHVSGGEVASAVYEGRVVYTGGGAPFNAVVISRDSAMTVDGATVELVGTGSAARAESLGRVRIEQVFPGRYVAKISTRLMWAAALAPVERRIDVLDRAQAEPVALPLPALDDMIRAACGPVRDATRKEAILFGTVDDTQHRPVVGATVAVTWQAGFHKEIKIIRWEMETHDARTDSEGRWRICHVPRDWPLSVIADVSGAKTDTLKVRIPETQALQPLHIVAPQVKP